MANPFLFIASPPSVNKGKRMPAEKPHTTSTKLSLFFGEPKPFPHEELTTKNFYQVFTPRLNAVLKVIPKGVHFTAEELALACGYKVPHTKRGTLTTHMKEAIGSAPNIREAYGEDGRVCFHIERKLTASFDVRKTMLDIRKPLIKGLALEAL